MKNTFNLLILLIFGILIYLIFSSSCLPKNSFLANGYLFGLPIQTTVDSKLAKQILENPDDQLVSDLFMKYEDATPNTKTLSEISKIYSVDVATFFFMKKYYEQEKSKFAQDLYTRMDKQINRDSIGDLRNYHIVFIPGLAYEEDPKTGADFSRQRRLLNSLKISNELIKTEEWGMSDINAQIIADRLKKITVARKHIMLVSASKGGLEVAIALGSLLKPDEISSVKSWISVGGILRGSPIADSYLKVPKRWYAKFMLWTKGKNINLVRDMSYVKRSKDFQDLVFPKHIKIIHYIGIPLATKVSKEIKSRYCTMKDFGPNDGLTPIADQVTENGIVISELGLDHYYRNENIDQKTLSLAVVAAKLMICEDIRE